MQRPWRRARYHDVVREVAGKDWFELSSEQRRDRATNEFKLEILPQLADFEVTQHVFEKLVEEKTIDPLFVTHCPKELVPLAKQNATDNSLVDVFELIINGAEIAPGYSELNDPVAQRQRLLEQAGEEKQKIDEEFLLALEHGMPPAGGFGLGMDRLTMLLTGEFNRRGQWQRVTMVVLNAGLALSVSVGLLNLSVKHPWMLSLMYVNVLGISVGSLYMITRDRMQKKRMAPS